MERVDKKLEWNDEKFKRRIGTTKPVFLAMLEILEEHHEKLHQDGGKPNDLSPGDKLLITLKYYREYVTMESIGDDYNCAKSSVCRSIHWVEDVLSTDGRFQLPGKKALEECDPKTVAIDAPRPLPCGFRPPLSGEAPFCCTCQKSFLVHRHRPVEISVFITSHTFRPSVRSTTYYAFCWLPYLDRSTSRRFQPCGRIRTSLGKL